MRETVTNFLDLEIKTSIKLLTSPEMHFCRAISEASDEIDSQPLIDARNNLISALDNFGVPWMK